MPSSPGLQDAAGLQAAEYQLGSDPTVREGTALGAAPCAWLHARQVLWEWGRQAITIRPS